MTNLILGAAFVHGFIGVLGFMVIAMEGPIDKALAWFFFWPVLLFRVAWKGMGRF